MPNRTFIIELIGKTLKKYEKDTSNFILSQSYEEHFLQNTAI